MKNFLYNQVLKHNFLHNQFLKVGILEREGPLVPSSPGSDDYE